LEEVQSTQARTAVLLNVFKHFLSADLSQNDVRTLTANYDVETRKAVISAYYLASVVLQEHKVANIPYPHVTALFDAAGDGKASVFALFGGQGIGKMYFDELPSFGTHVSFTGWPHVICPVLGHRSYLRVDAWPAC
jgi:fatty acid synthase subunit alpha